MDSNYRIINLNCHPLNYMKPIKVFYNGKRLRDVYPHATRWQVFKWKMHRFFRKVFILTAIVATCYGIFQAGHYINPKTIIQVDAQEIVKEVETQSAVMARIAKCESPTGHWKNGQVSMSSNTNRSVDIGKYQINTVWSKTAADMGLDLTKEKDNEAFAMWLYKNKGTEPWYSSKSCWNK